MWDWLLGGIGKDILNALGSVVQFCLNGLFSMSASIFEGALGMGFDSKTAAVIKTGWTACRDFTNMLFILFMVIIAFATILRTEQYGIKKLLPKVIGVALLINFSFVLCSVFVDFSNITANFFIKDIKGKIGDKNGAISGQLATAFNITGIYTTIKNCDEILKVGKLDCDKLTVANLTTFGLSYAACVEAYTKSYNDCKKQGGLTVKVGDDNFLELMLGYTIGSILMIIAIFALCAGALMILFRIIAIWFLITIVPLAFICYVLPGLQDNWKKWWTKFLHWCIFAPVYTFFIWMAIQIAVTKANTKMGIDASNFALSGNYKILSNAFVNNPGGELISFLIIIGFLMGSLVVAQTLSIYGANAAMKIATNAKNGATNWAKRTAMRPAKGLGRLAGAGALTAGGALFGDTKLGRRMQARAAGIKMRLEKDPRNVAYERLTSTMSDENAMKESMVKAITPGQKIRKLIATRNANRRGLFRDAKTGEAGEAMKTFKSFNDSEAYQKLKETRLDAIEDNTERDNTTKKVVQEGNLNKIPAIALKDERVVAALGRFASAVQIESLRNASPQHTTNLKNSLDTLTTAGNAILAGMNASDQEKIHHSYASQTGDIGRMTGAQLPNWAKHAGADGIKRIEWKEESAKKMQIVAENIPDNQAGSAIAKINNGKVAKEMALHLAKVKPNIVENDFILKGLVGKANIVNLKPENKTTDEEERVRRNLNNI